MNSYKINSLVIFFYSILRRLWKKKTFSFFSCTFLRDWFKILKSTNMMTFKFAEIWTQWLQILPKYLICTAIPYRASTGTEQDFLCVLFPQREKVKRENPVFITGMGLQCVLSPKWKPKVWNPESLKNDISSEKKSYSRNQISWRYRFWICLHGYYACLPRRCGLLHFEGH